MALSRNLFFAMWSWEMRNADSFFSRINSVTGNRGKWKHICSGGEKDSFQALSSLSPKTRNIQRVSVL
jgi:hypothetical protein